MTRAIIFYSLAALCILFILFITYLANNGLGHDEIFVYVAHIPGKDKTCHFFVMGLLTFFLNVAMNCKKTQVLGRDLLKGSVILLIAITLEEGSQYFVEGRTLSIQDLAANYAGIFLFGKLAQFFRRS